MGRSAGYPQQASPNSAPEPADAGAQVGGEQEGDPSVHSLLRLADQTRHESFGVDHRGFGSSVGPVGWHVSLESTQPSTPTNSESMDSNQCIIQMRAMHIVVVLLSRQLDS
jgi:hypothetical protein